MSQSQREETMIKINSYGTFTLVGGVDIRRNDPYFIYDTSKDIIKLPVFSSRIQMSAIEAFLRASGRFLLKDGNCYKEVSEGEMEMYLFGKVDDRIAEYNELIEARRKQLLEYVNTRKNKKTYKFNAGAWGIHKLCEEPCRVSTSILKSAYCSERRWHY